MSERRPRPVLHLRAAEPRRGSAPSATIMGNRAGLAALRDLVDAALESEAGNSNRVLFEADSADYVLSVWLARSREEMGDPAGLGP